MFQRRAICSLALLACLASLLSPPCFNTAVWAAPEPRWSYNGVNSPAHWGQIDPSFSTCDTGQQQSPIELSGAAAIDLPNLSFSYAPSSVQIINNGRTLQANYAPGSRVLLEGEPYELLQFHFHSPSEHSIRGMRLPMELHLVHRSDSGALAVVGVLIEPGAENPVLQGVWEQMVLPKTAASPTAANPAAASTTAPPSSIQVDATVLLPNQQTSYRYLGSLTTPPCSEGVQWIVMEHPIQLSPEQIEQFRALFHSNRRPIQALNGRSLRLDASP